MDASSQIRRLLGLSSADDLQLESESFSADGFLSYRRRGSIRRDSGTLSTRLFVKASDTSRSELNEAQEFSHKACRNECLFYAVMCPILARSSGRCRLRLPIPRVFGERVTDTTSVLVMEDLTEQGFSGTDKKLLTLEEAECVVKAMAELQAAYWLSRTDLNYHADAAVFGASSIFHESKKPIDNPIITPSLHFFANHFAEFARSSEDERVIADALPRLREFVASEPASHLDRPLGIVHGDLWFSNFMLKRSGSSLECRIFDWQFWRVGLFGCDVGQLTLTCLPTRILQRELHNLVAMHFRAFREAYERSSCQKVPFSEEEAKKNLSDSLIRGFLWNVVTFTTSYKKDIFESSEIIASIAYVIRTGLLTFDQ